MKAFPKAVKRHVGQALYAAQRGEEYPYRAVYTMRFQGAVYVLHAFQKKSKKGITTPQKERERLSWR